MNVLFLLFSMLEIASPKSLLFDGSFEKIVCPKYCFCDYIRKSVDCSKNNLSEIPRDIFRDVEILDVSFNNFNKTPTWIMNLPKLVYLDISHNPAIQSIATDFKSASLKNLVVKSCALENFNNSVFQNFPNLQVFDISNNPITYLNDSLDSLSLQYLILHKSRLKRIKPDTFTKMKSLTYLSLQGNYNLRQFHCGLDKLTVLDLSNCNLEHVPSGSLKTVVELNLQGNNIQLLKNKSLSNLQNVQSLNISFNAMKSIEVNSFSHLKGLKTLDLSFNRLTSIENNTFSMNLQLSSLYLSHNYLKLIREISSKTLEFLDLSSCEIRSLPRKALGNVPVLKELHLARNQIASIPDYFEGVRLVYFDVSHNEITAINNKTFASLKFLRFLVMSGNKLTTIEPSFFPQIIDLSIDDNPWTCDCEALRPMYIWMLQTDQYIRNLRCQSGFTWEEACYNTWNKIVTAQSSVWWYSLAFLVIVLLFVILIYMSKKIEKRKKHEEEIQDEERRATEHLEFLNSRMRELERQREQEQEESRNAPDPRELQSPPSYNEALLLPRLDASHPSLAGSLSSVNLNNSNPDVSKKRRQQRRKRRRRRSFPSQSVSSANAADDASENDKALNVTELDESSF